jgi:streptogramin lyase
VSIVLLVLVVFSVSAAAEEMPSELRGLCMTAKSRPFVLITVDGEDFLGVDRIPGTPYLLWPETSAEVPYDQAAATDWVRRLGTVLGHRDFTPVFSETYDWRGSEAWIYTLFRKGIGLHDARVVLLWDGARLLGVINNVPGPIGSIDEPDGHAPGEQVYVARRNGSAFQVELAEIRSETTESRRTDSLLVDEQLVHRIVEPVLDATITGVVLDEWAIPAGSFPDQIDIDTSGVVWFSQPFENWLVAFDPTTEEFTPHSTTGGQTPDGMMVDSADVAWTGLYDTDSGLGRLDIATSGFTVHAPPYSPANMAIPSETASGAVWVTDHERNRISLFDPDTQTWPQSFVMPTPGCWVVGGIEDPTTEESYFTEYSADQLGRTDLDGPIVDIAMPFGSEPAFAAYSNGHVYFSEWNRNRLGDYEVASGLVTEHVFPVANEGGGPIDATPGGLVAVGTRNVGYIMVFNPMTGLFGQYQVPTGGSGLKDGLRAAADGVIWFTESGANKIARLDLGGQWPVADFTADVTSGDPPLEVVFTDLSTNAPTAWSWDFGDGETSTEQHPTHTYTTDGLYTVTLTAGNDYGFQQTTKVDYIDVGGDSLIFADGFESGGTTAWSGAMP